MSRSFLLIPLIIVGVGCTTTAPVSTNIPVKRVPIAEISDATLKLDYAHERQFLGNMDERPRFGLALSGGGTKAAMFAHGVLHGLHNAGILQEVDVISTVSGGGYAALWYYTKLLESSRQGFPIESIFADCIPRYWTDPPKKGDDPRLDSAMKRATLNLDPAKRHTPERPVCASAPYPAPEHYSSGDPYRWQAHLVRWPDVFGTSPVSPNGTAQKKPEAEIRAGLFNGLFIEPVLQMLGQRSSIPDLYQSGIERAWGLNPEQRLLGAKQQESKKWKYSNAVLANEDEPEGPWRLNPKTVTWDALRKLHAGASQNPSAPKIPVWIVNTNSGNKTGNALQNANHTFELSAFGTGGKAFGYVNDIEYPPIPDLATSVRASAGFADAQGLAGWKRTVLDWLDVIWPGAKWGVPVEVPTTAGTSAFLRLSDGGGAENLGLYSLLKRGVQDIIVVDAAEDIEGDMSDLCAVRGALDVDGIDLQFDKLENFKDICTGNQRYNVSDWSNPVVSGTATWKSGIKSRIWLIKAAWDQRAVADAYTKTRCGEPAWADCFLTVFYGHNSMVGVDGLNAGGTNMAFPQLPTAGSTANSSTYLFWGYRELGRTVGEHLSFSKEKGIERLGDECTVRAYPRARKGDRPTALRPAESKLPCKAEVTKL